MASPLTSYFKSVSIDEHTATAFQPRESGQKTAKRPTIFATCASTGSTAMAYLSVLKPENMYHPLGDAISDRTFTMIRIGAAPIEAQFKLQHNSSGFSNKLPPVL